MLSGMSRLILWIILALSLAGFGCTPAFADEPLRLEPSSPWNVHYGEDSCRLARDFGEGEDRIMLYFDRYQPGDVFRMVVAGRPVRRASSRDVGQIRFGDHEITQEFRLERGEIGQHPAIFLITPLRIGHPPEPEGGFETLPPPTPENWNLVASRLSEIEPQKLAQERYRSALHIWLDARRMTPMLLETGPLNLAFAALEACTDELLRRWGVDVEVHRTLSRETISATYPGHWIRSANYPRQELRRGNQGLVYFRLGVDAEGNATECHIQRSTRGEGFRSAVCEALMENAAFLPALDAEGNPVASYHVSSVFFSMR